MKELGKRYALRLESLIQKIKNINVLVRTTDIDRTKQSANEFMNGFFESWLLKPDKMHVNTTEDYLLKYPDVCENFMKVFKLLY